MEKIQLGQLIDLAKLQKLAEAHYGANGTPIGIIDADHNTILVGVGWQDICTKFHRTHPLTCERCFESDNFIKNRLNEGGPVSYKCENGLYDIGVPIFVEGKHKATLFLGQFFYDGEVPDREFFTQQGLKFGFDLEIYLAALDRVPVFTCERVEAILTYNQALAEFISTVATMEMQRKRAVQELHESEEKYHTLFEMESDAICMIDNESGRILEFNDAVVNLYGFSRVELASMKIDDLSAESDEISRLTTNGYSWGPTHWHRKKDGMVFPVEITGRHFVWHGRPVHVAAIRDITTRKNAENEIRRLNESLGEQVKESTQRLEITTKELESFAYSISHDLRAPLRSMAGFGQILLDDYLDVLDEDGAMHLQRIITSSQRMGLMIDDLLTLARITRAELKMASIDLSALANSILDELQKADPDRQVEIVIRPDINVEGDPALIRMAMTHLLANAWKFTEKKEHARIEMGIQDESGKPIYFIRDNGIGFEMEFAERLFRAFERLNPDYESDGTGIGLAFANRIILRHNGRIWAEGSLGEGATFYFTLFENRS